VAEGAADDPAGMGAAVRGRPYFAVVDMAMPLCVAIARPFAEAAPNTKVVPLGVTDTEARVRACAEAGLPGYVSPERRRRRACVGHPSGGPG